jgi:hypothetical protein
LSTYTYSGLNGFTSTVSATTAGTAIAALTNGFSSTAKQVVDAARDPSSTLHGVFTWPGNGSSDAHTGEEDRLERAQALLNAIIIS